MDPETSILLNQPTFFPQLLKKPGKCCAALTQSKLSLFFTQTLFVSKETDEKKSSELNQPNPAFVFICNHDVFSFF